jgi:hypothetical protein
MKPQQQYPGEWSSIIPEGHPTLQPPPVFTVGQFCERNPAFTPPSLRNLIFKAESRESTKGLIPGNGLIECGAVIRIGRKVLLHEARFFSWVDHQQERGAS